MNDIECTVKVNTTELRRQLNKLDLSKMTPTELEQFIKENIEVTLIESSTEKRFYPKLKGVD